MMALFQIMFGILCTQVVACDVTKELCEYGVEYHVLQEEMSAPRPEAKKIKELESQNERLRQQVTGLSHQLQVCMNKLGEEYPCYFIESKVKIKEIWV